MLPRLYVAYAPLFDFIYVTTAIVFMLDAARLRHDIFEFFRYFAAADRCRCCVTLGVDMLDLTPDTRRC